MKWFLNLKTSAKLISSFVTIAILLAAVGLYTFSNMSMLNGNVKEVYNNNLMSIKELSNAQINYQMMRVAVRDMSVNTNKAEKDKLIQDIEAYKKDYQDSINLYHKTAVTKPEMDELKLFDPILATYFKTYDQAVQIAYGNDLEQFLSFQVSQLNPLGVKMRESLGKLIDMNVQIAEDTYHESNTAYATSRTVTIAVIVIAFLFSVLLGIYISRTIANPLVEIAALVENVAQGDLRGSSSRESKDEIGQLSRSINHMIQSWQTMIGGIMQSSHSVAAASEEISASSQEIAGSSSSQAQAAQQITDLFSELSTAIQSVASGAEQAAELSSETVQTARNGGVIVDASMESMQAVNAKMALLEDDSQKIGDIIEVIDDIADQTNLLALNAAIEAARAGDQGRGFAVVADEVRKLAERSSEATKQITIIIKAMQQNTKISVQAVLDGVAQTSRTGEAFRQIVAMVDASANKVNEIAAACEQQSAQASEVMSSVQSIAAASEEAAAASEQTAGTCQSLAGLADELSTSVASFKLR
ncbi:MAG: methyl-accepting chemotaxis protein [Paenibacillus sp.]|nr:methyl-accepting chemotaxis protein [Paenibacillus sp.]